MNIEGAERLAIRGMVETLPRTQTLGICCHDFLAEMCGDDLLRTRQVVTDFLRQHGICVNEETSFRALPYVRKQVWAYHEP